MRMKINCSWSCCLWCCEIPHWRRQPTSEIALSLQVARDRGLLSELWTSKEWRDRSCPLSARDRILTSLAESNGQVGGREIRVRTRAIYTRGVRGVCRMCRVRRWRNRRRHALVAAVYIFHLWDPSTPGVY
jgi:hypothetical protein